MNAPLKQNISPEIEKNPLVSYLKVFQNQHKVITVLYRGLIASFAGFVILLSILIVSKFDSDIIPMWGIGALAVIDFLLLFGVVKSFLELNKYKNKSGNVLSKIHEYLKNDLIKLERIKSEHANIKDTHKKIRSKMLSFSSKSGNSTVNEYRGWDNQVCPKCNSSVEMLVEVCPQCHHNLGKMLQN